MNGTCWHAQKISILGDLSSLKKPRKLHPVLGKPNFKGSNGWLQKWKVRYNIKQVTVSGESGDVRLDTVESWKERLPELLHGFRKTYGTLMKPAVFGKHCQTEDLIKRGKSAKEERKC